MQGAGHNRGEEKAKNQGFAPFFEKRKRKLNTNPNSIETIEIEQYHTSRKPNRYRKTQKPLKSNQNQKKNFTNIQKSNI